jgi:hypothetical protein
MPTGYTAAIKDGITFEQFVMQCSRAMGAMVMMRDEPFDAPIPERFDPSNYHTEKLAEAEKLLAWYENMADSEVDRERLKEYQEEVASRDERIKQAGELLAKYESMRDAVSAWVPPTPDHEGFRDFMLKQIDESIKFDCNTSYYSQPELYGTSAWRDIKIMKARRDIEYHRAEHAKEVERTESRNAWIKALRESLKD